VEAAAMGLYDNVHCKYPLPDPEAQDLDYQTKSTFAPFSDHGTSFRPRSHAIPFAAAGFDT
jgi:hypothetical protein